MPLEYAPMDPVLSEMSRPLPALAWGVDGKLKQRWQITSYTNNSPSGYREEWRDVPTLAADET